MTPTIKDLPKKLRVKAEKRMLKQRGFIDEKYPLCIAFNWKDTKEGFDFWRTIDEGNPNGSSDKKKVTLEEFLGIDPRLISVTDVDVVKPDPIVESVVNQLRDRSEVGIKKYGTTLDDNNLSTKEWIEHAKQEAMDFVLYLEKLKTTL
jgi:hypothetical protein